MTETIFLLKTNLFFFFFDYILILLVLSVIQYYFFVFVKYNFKKESKREGGERERETTSI